MNDERMTRSRYTDAVDRHRPLDVYPNPMLERASWINLNGIYRYAIVPEGSPEPTEYEGDILVPFCVESPLSGVGRPLEPGQTLWYRRTFDAPSLAGDERLILHFEAVDDRTEVLLNGRSLGIHAGGYEPFSFDVTDRLAPGENVLVAAVSDPSDAGGQERGKQVLKPGGIWYTATSGIWQTVWMEVVNAVRVADLVIRPDYDHAEVGILPKLSCASDARIVLSIRGGDGPIVSADLAEGEFTHVAMPDFVPWSPERPFLYEIEIDVVSGGRVLDHVRSHFGMRKIALGHDAAGLPRILLNGRPYFQAGVLDQGYWPDGLLTQPTDQALVDDILAMKALGFNMLRKHIKIESRRWYWHCDRLGMLVWQDMPSGGEGALGKWLGAIRPYAFPRLPISDRRYARFGRSSESCRTRFLKGLEAMVGRLSCHPSIVCWVPFNEAWGQFDARKTALYVRSLDPTRLVDHASGWYDQKGGDLKSIHRYILAPKAPRPEPRRAFVLSEFGGYSRLAEGHVWNPRGSFGYRMYPTAAAITDAYRTLLAEQILPLVGLGLCATVYTQLSDVELEVNGLLTYDREVVKLDAEVVRFWNEALKRA
ncbi:MAG: sugar-binding domain-containing protein [Candidatus Izemoplasmatales bacterium]